MGHHTFLMYAITYLGVAVLAVPLFRRLGLSSVLGYLAAGSLIGPWGFGVINDPERILTFAELGVVFLLFIIGLELSPRRLKVMRKAVFRLGTVQVLVTGLVISLLTYACGVSAVSAFVIGFSLSLSSTAFALQVMSEKRQLGSAFGRASFGILLFQDLAAIPLLAIVPILSRPAVGAEADLAIAFLKVFGVIVGLIFAGRFLLQPLLRIVAAAGMREIFTAGALLLVLGTALLMESIGISMALGAFLAGLLLADSEHRHELEADIEPFKGLLLGLFFISIGMSVNYGLAVEMPMTIIGAVIALLAVKSILLYAIGRFVGGLKPDDARSMALTIPQGGEFAFVVFNVAVAAGVLENRIAGVLTLIVTLSMALTPLLVLWNERYLQRVLGERPAPFDEISDEGNPVLIAGFGRFGQIVGRVLRVRRIGFTALDHDQEQVNVLRKFGNKVYYGDASRLELLESAGAKQARFFILAIDDMQSSLKTAAIVRQHFPHLKIYARARNRQHAFELLNLGVTLIHRETLGTSVEVARALLLDLEFDEVDVDDTIRRFRQHDEEMLAEQYKLRHNEKEFINYSRQYARQLADLFESDRSR